MQYKGVRAQEQRFGSPCTPGSGAMGMERKHHFMIGYAFEALGIRGYR